MEKVTAKEKTVREILSNQRYNVDYYQREYKWQEKHLQELIDDLVEVFDNNYEDEHPREKIRTYDKYFLGSIIICEKDNKRYIIDGQQRLTTITLILIFIRNKISDNDQKAKLYSLIFSDTYGVKSYNIDVPERKECFDELVKGNIPDLNNFDESIENLIARYNELENLFPDDFDEKKFLYFSDWLIENVFMVEITTHSEDDAYLIFETMNDRGLSLSPVEMLKGYLLSNINETDKRNYAAKIWKEKIEMLRHIGKDEDSEAFKAWLRGKYANTIREKRKGSTPEDFEKIGTELHRWVKEKEDYIGLKKSDDFYNFICKDIRFYADVFNLIKDASKKMTPGLEMLYYVLGFCGFTSPYPLLFASLNANDDKETVLKKIQIVGTYIDILIARRLWSYKSVNYRSLQYIFFGLAKEIRNKSLYDLAEILFKKLNEDKFKFTERKDFVLIRPKKVFYHYMLARIIEFIELNSGMQSRFLEYVAKGPNRYEIEHIWSQNAYKELKDEFNNISEFENYRNRIGGLLLLPKKFNASYGSLSYKEKLVHYYGQNILAQSLHENCYKNNPGFLNFVQKSGLPFKPHPEFRKKDLEERQNLYCMLAEMVWSPERIERILNEKSLHS